jgi:hypothetical protein
MQQDLLNRYLGDRPTMLVTGVPVTQAQAQEIIRRTDRLFGSLTTNDYPYLVRVSRELRIPLWEAYERELRRNAGYREYEANLAELRAEGGTAYAAALCGEHYDAYLAALDRWHEAHRRWLDAWGYVETEYVVNDWVSDQFIYGPHGWCHPDGTMGHIDRVGKGQIAEEVLGDWRILASAFPFLDLGVTLVREGLYAGERDMAQVGLLVRGGEVLLVDPAEVDVHAGHSPPTRGGPQSGFASDRGKQGDLDNLAALLTVAQIFGPAGVRRAIPWEWIESWSGLSPDLGER